MNGKKLKKRKKRQQPGRFEPKTSRFAYACLTTEQNGGFEPTTCGIE
jgi:hypothetical protein